MADQLSAFLREQARVGFTWGGSDCLLLPADWAWELTGIDPAAPWRGRYRDEGGADAILSEAGGAEALIARGLQRSPDKAHAVRGDIGLITVTGPEGRAEVGAICTGERWAARARRGLWIGRAEPLAIWKMEFV